MRVTQIGEDILNLEHSLRDAKYVYDHVVEARFFHSKVLLKPFDAIDDVW